MKMFRHALVVSHIGIVAKCSSDHFKDSCAEPLMQEGSAVVQAVNLADQIDAEGRAVQVLQNDACTEAQQMVLMPPSGDVRSVVKFPINNTGYSAYFKAIWGGATKLIGKPNGHGQIDLKCGSIADIEFGFVRGATNIKVPMDHVALTFYDFQQGGQSVEACASRVFMSENAQLAVNINEKCGKFRSCNTPETHELAAPGDPKHRATFLWDGEKNLRFRLEVQNCSKSSDRSFSFAFDPSAACESTAADVMQVGGQQQTWRPRTCCDVGSQCDKTLHVSKATHR